MLKKKMTYKLDKIITKHGDKGETRLGNKDIVKKNSKTVEALGSIDELNSSIGLLKLYISDSLFKEMLTTIQHHILILGSEVAGTGRSFIQERHVLFIEEHAYDLIAKLEPRQDFVLPQGDLAGANCHVTRTICRRAERAVVAASEDYPENTIMPIQYLNRLADLLFVLARTLNKADQVEEILFDRER